MTDSIGSPAPPPSRRRRAAAVGAWLALSGGAVLALHAAAGALPGPPLGSPSHWPHWAEERDAVVIAFAVVRLLGLVAAWYVLVVTAVGVGLRLVSARRLSAVVDRLTVVPLRRLVATTVAVGISAGPVAGAGATALVAPTSVPVSASVPAGVGPPVTVTMHLVTPSGDPPPTSVAPAAAPSPPPVPEAPSSIPVPPSAAPALPESAEAPWATWTVRSGECFWSIADEVLARAWGRPPADAEIVPYWRLLIEANRVELADPDNPDLVFPGQVFSLPDV